MAISIRVYPELSPRIIEVLSPATEATVQDIINACRAWEDLTPNLAYPFLIDAAGKEDLGGGVSVGITATLQNAVIAFEQRGVSDSGGSVTTADAAGTVLKDSAGTFITDGIQAGDSVLNTTDGSIATITSVDSEIQVTHFPLEGGTDNDWDSADTYTIWNKVQCEISGGNLVAVDGSGTPISAFLPTALTHVIRTASSSATTTSQAQLEYATFNSGVSVNAATGTSGTTYPQGTPGAPVDNIPDAITIAEERDFSKLFIQGDITLDTGDIVDNYVIIGENANKSAITVNTGASTLQTEFIECFLTGTLDGGAIIRNSVIGPLAYVDGIIFTSMINTGTTITLSGAGTAHFLDCFSGTPGSGTPTIDFDGAGSALAMRGYKGGVLLTNKIGADACSVDLDSGQVKLDPNATTGFTNGELVVRGDGKVINSDTGDYIPNGSSSFNSATIINEANSPEAIADAVWDEAVSNHVTTGTFGKQVKDLLKFSTWFGLK